MDEIDRLERLDRLRESGALTQDEFEKQKARLFAGRPEARLLPGRKWLWLAAAIAFATLAVAFVVASQYRAASPVPPQRLAVVPATSGPTSNEVAPAPAPREPECAAPACRILTPRGWAAVRVGTRVDAAMRAAGLRLRHPGHYDSAFADEPDRLVACNIYGIVGAPENISVFVENHIITSIGAGLPGENGGAIFETDRGVRLGDPESAVRRAYPRLEQQPDIYSQPPDKMLFFRGPRGLGIKFSIADGRVAAIDVGGPSINYVEGCL